MFEYEHINNDFTFSANTLRYLSIRKPTLCLTHSATCAEWNTLVCCDALCLTHSATCAEWNTLVCCDAVSIRLEIRKDGV